MKKGFLRFVAVFMAVLMTAVYLPLSEIDTVFDVEASAIVTNGKVNLGSNIKWTYDNKSRTITVSGSGAMYNFSNGDDGQRWDELVLGLTHYPNKDARNLVISNGITSIGNNAFNGLKGITNVTIPESVTSIGTGAFRGCEALTSVKIPSKVTVINNDTFYGCTSLSSVNINEGITSIGANAFRDTKVSSVVMPYSVTSIGSNAFSTVKITCNYNDVAYRYCSSHGNATAVMRTPSLKAEIVPGSEPSLITVNLYIKDASGFNAGNFQISYNEDIAPVSTDYIFSTNNEISTAIVFAAGNKVNIAVSALSSVNIADCGAECSYKVAELTFRLADGTHVAKITYGSSVLMLCDKRYNVADTFVEFGEHNFVAQGSPIAATCTDYGYTLYKCTICSEEREMNKVNALGHSYGAGVVTAPTCEDDGYTSYTCSRCGDVKTDSVVSATGHTISEVINAATCTVKGNKTIICTVCGHSAVAEEYDLDPANHVNTTVKNAVTATCSAAGYTGDTYCADCDAFISAGSVIAVGDHTYNAVVTAPTCTTKGYTTYTCKDCSYTYTGDETDVAAHDYNAVVTAPTCTTKGYTTYTCKDCSYTYTGDETDVTAHDYEAVVTAPTCTAKGYTTYTCKDCSASYVGDETDIIAHDYEEAVTAPTCTAKGYTTYTCKDCGFNYRAAETDMLAHSYVGAVVTEPTCQAAGETVYTCESCGTSYSEEIPVIAHDFETTVTAPTCSAKGYTLHTCKACGYNYRDTETDTTAHNYTEASRKAATCTEEGKVTYKCTECSAKYSETLPVVAHTYSSETVEATCKEYGYTIYTCDVCGDSYRVDGDKQYAEHDYDTTVTAPTCKDAGYSIYKCSVCGHSYKGSYTPALGHSYDADGMCTRCGAEEGTDLPPVTSSELAFNDEETFIMNNDDKTVLSRKPLTAAELKAAITTSGWVITAADGTELDDSKNVATGCIIKSEDGSVVYYVAILGDITCDGKITAADARITLRVAARVDSAEPIAQLAANCDGKANVSASDARIILRVSARIQTF